METLVWIGIFAFVFYKAYRIRQKEMREKESPEALWKKMMNDPDYRKEVYN